MTAKLMLPGKSSQVSLQLLKNMTAHEWLECGRLLVKMEGAVQWWMGDWWVYGAEREYGEGRELAEKVGVNYWTISQYGSVCRAFEFCDRSQNLSFTHHLRAMSAPEKQRIKWLERAAKEDWSPNQLAAQIRFQAARDKTTVMELLGAGRERLFGHSC